MSETRDKMGRQLGDSGRPYLAVAPKFELQTRFQLAGTSCLDVCFRPKSLPCDAT